MILQAAELESETQYDIWVWLHSLLVSRSPGTHLPMLTD